MIVDVMEYEKKYTFELQAITQLCGLNIMKKKYVLESLRRYFGTYKYREEKNKWRDNVRIDKEIVGRKFFTVISISSMGDLLSMIKLSKQSLMMEYVKLLMQKYDWQMHLRVIQEELEEIFQMMNSDVNQLGEIELVYEMADTWEMIQKSNVSGVNETLLEDKTNYELLNIFLKMLEQVLKSMPKKMLVIIENLDHFISKVEYKEFLNLLRDVVRRYDIYFLITTSLEGYVKYDMELCTGITIFNDVDFQVPELEKISKYINDNYPYHVHISEEKLQEDLEKITHKIGKKNFLQSVEENVICKLINQSLMIYDKMNENVNPTEIAFLNA